MPRIPKYKLHPASGRGQIQYRPIWGKNAHYLPGKFNSPESLAAFQACIEQVLQHMRDGGKRVDPPTPKPEALTVALLCRKFLPAAKTRIKTPSEFDHFRVVVLKWLLLQCPAVLVDDFGPLKFKALRSAMIKKGSSRNHINHQCRRIVRIFKWGVGEEMVEARIVHALEMVPALREGEEGVRETQDVAPVDWSVAERVLPFVAPMVADMIRLQHYSGMRSSEVTTIKPCEIDMRDKVWVYKPPKHKMRHRKRQKKKRICIGPQSQEILRRYMPADPNAYFFPPSLAVEQHLAARRARRKSKVYGKPKPAKKRTFDECYTAHAYQGAINNGLRALAKSLLGVQRNRKGEGRQKREPLRTLLARAGVEYWHPHQLRHSRATITEDSHGIEAAAAVIGDGIDAAKIYAERSLKLAWAVALETG